MPRPILERYPFLKDIADKKRKSAIDEIIKNADSLRAYQYCFNKHKRISELEPLIMACPTLIVSYSLNVIKGRWEDAEPELLKYSKWDASSALDYAIFVMKCPWPAAEKYIARCPRCSWEYAKNVLRGRFKLAEPLINGSCIYKRYYWRDMRSEYFNKVRDSIIKIGGIIRNAISI